MLTRTLEHFRTHGPWPKWSPHLVGVVDAHCLQLELEEGAAREVRLQQLLRQEPAPLQLQPRLSMQCKSVLTLDLWYSELRHCCPQQMVVVSSESPADKRVACSA